MADKLLVRIYNVGLGDCIYLRVPDENDHLHILIDCGNKFSELELLGQRIEELKTELPDAGSGIRMPRVFMPCRMPLSAHCKVCPSRLWAN
jgi:hypothetical protein